MNGCTRQLACPGHLECLKDIYHVHFLYPQIEYLYKKHHVYQRSSHYLFSLLLKRQSLIGDFRPLSIWKLTTSDCRFVLALACAADNH